MPCKQATEHRQRASERFEQPAEIFRVFVWPWASAQEL